MDSSEIKKNLSRTWIPFFGHFGSFTPIQEMAIPLILKNKNVVVISPSASGKTEAVVAPILERLLERQVFRAGRNKLRVLYISPTRALVNDLHRRLRNPIHYLDISLGVKTGDRPHLSDKKVPGILLTTPESFDSLLTRRPKLFLDLQAVILDEIHLLDNTPRGDQLRILLNRLRKIRSRLHYAALSATIDDLDIGERYFPDPEVCLLESRREIEYLLVHTDAMIEKLKAVSRERNLKKILVFFNARSLAEIYSRKLSVSPFSDMVYVHHASLPKSKREDIEKAMNSTDHAVLCATSTLELGVDIGSVDCIVLYRPPFDVSSMLQRIGRGNRRTHKLFAIGVYTDGWEKNLFETYLECAMQGRLYDKRYTPSLSVIPQQIYSYFHQRRRIGTTMNSLSKIIYPVFSEDTVKSVFKHLYEEGKVVETRPGIYFNSPDLEKKIEYGKIHSNIAESSFGEYDVIDVALGIVVGRIFHLREKFVLGGKCWQIGRIDEKEKRVYARCIGDASAVAKVFEGKGAGSYNYRLAPVIKRRFIPELAFEDFPYTVEGTKTHIIHLLGSMYGFVLADSLFHDGIDVTDVEGKIFVLNGYVPSDARFPIPSDDAIKRVLRDGIRRLEDALGSGAYFYDLPLELQIEDHWLNMDIDGFLSFLGSLRLVPTETEQFREYVGSLR